MSTTDTPPRAEPRRTSAAALTCAITACALGVAAVVVWGLDVGARVHLLLEPQFVLVVENAPQVPRWRTWVGLAWPVLLCVAILVTAFVSSRAALSGRAPTSVVVGVLSILLSTVPAALRFG